MHVTSFLAPFKHFNNFDTFYLLQMSDASGDDVGEASSLLSMDDLMI